MRIGIRRFFSMLATSVAVGASAVVITASPAVATEVVVDDCGGESVTLAGEYEQAYLGGDVVFVSDNTGEANPLEGSDGKNFGDVPMCGVRQLDGESHASWMYCTDLGKPSCGQRPASTVDENPKVSPENQQRIAYLIQNLPGDTKEERAVVQTQVWCLSEGQLPGVVFTHAQDYFQNGQGISLTDGEATCANPVTDIDPHLNVVDVLELTGPAGPTNAGEQARFPVNTNLSTPISVTGNEGSTITVCADDVSGAVLENGVLTLTQTVTALTDTATTVQLCGTRADGGEVKVSLAASTPTRQNLRWNYAVGNECQVFADFNTATPEQLTAEAVAPFAGPVTPPTTPVAPAPAPAQPELAATGFDTTPYAIGGLALLTAGAVLLFLVRRKGSSKV